MNRVSSSVYRGAIFAATLALVFAVGCKKNPPKAPEPVKAPEAPPPPKPTVSIQASPTSINKG